MKEFLFICLIALLIGGSTLAGSAIGLLFRKQSHRFNDMMLGLAAGVMLAAAVFGLLQPAAEAVEGMGILWVIAGIFAGAVLLNLMDNFTPHLHRLTGLDPEEHLHNASINRLMLFVLGIALHKLPEGMAAGVGFNAEDLTHAWMVAGGITFQNIPEGLIVVAPLFAIGLKRRRILLIATGVAAIEVIGTFLGFYLGQLSAALLPFALSLAGGAMLYVISDEMIVETHSHGYAKASTFMLICGFTLMLVADKLI